MNLLPTKENRRVDLMRQPHPKRETQCYYVMSADLAPVPLWPECWTAHAKGSGWAPRVPVVDLVTDVGLDIP